MTLKPAKSCSPEVLAQIAEVIPVPVLISNFGGDGIFDHKIAFANSAFTQLTGFKNEHIIGRSPEFICDRGNDDAIMEFYHKCNYEDEFEVKLNSIKKNGQKIKLLAKVAVAKQEGAAGAKSYIITCSEIAEQQPAWQDLPQDFGVQVAARAVVAPTEHEFEIPVAPIISPEIAMVDQEEVSRENIVASAMAKQVEELQELMRQKEELQNRLLARKAEQQQTVEPASISFSQVANDHYAANQQSEYADEQEPSKSFVQADYDSIINQIVAELGSDIDFDAEPEAELEQTPSQTAEQAIEQAHLTDRHNVLETVISNIRRRSNEQIDGDEKIVQLKQEVQDKAMEDQIDHYAKTRFLANMSHDLRTPLNAIIGFSEVIRDQLFGPIDNQRYVSYANDIFKSGQELLATISEILELSEIDAQDNLQLDEVEFDICETIDSVLDLLSAKAFQTDVKVMKRLNVHDMHMHGDRRKLKQAVGGIIGNAIKCSPSGGKIEVVSEIDENGDFRFITYLRSANLIATRASLGSLLGTVTNKVESEYPEISLAKRFTEAHDGNFSIFNSATSGTEITLTIPKARLIDQRKARLQVITNG